MDAIRCKGQQRGFRVGEILFRYDIWTPVDETTEDMRVDGMLEIIPDVSGPDDPRLFPFALLTEDDCPPLTMDQIGQRLQDIEQSRSDLLAQVESLEADKGKLSDQVTNLEGQIAAMSTTDTAQKKQIADLTKRVSDLEAAAKAAATASTSTPATPFTSPAA